MAVIMKQITKLKRTEVAEYKKQLLVQQGFICPICGGSLRGITISKIALDHDHITGLCRGVLHMGCNRSEGIINNALHKWSRLPTTLEKVRAVRRLADYWEDSLYNPKDKIYPTHKEKK